jgi:hypothetical protein
MRTKVEHTAYIGDKRREEKDDEVDIGQGPFQTEGHGDIHDIFFFAWGWGMLGIRCDLS